MFKCREALIAFASLTALKAMPSYAQEKLDIDGREVTIENIDTQQDVTQRELVRQFSALARGEVGYGEKFKNANLDDKEANYNGGGDYTKYGRDIDASGMYAPNQKLQGQWWCKTYVDWIFYTTIKSISEAKGLKVDAAQLTCDLLLQQKGGPIIRVSQMYNKFKNANLLADSAQEGDIIAIEKIQLDKNGKKIASEITHTAIVVKSEQVRNGLTYFYIGEGNSPNASGAEKGKVRTSRYTYEKNAQGENVLFVPNAKPDLSEIQIAHILRPPYEIVLNKMKQRTNKSYESPIL